MFNSLSVYFDSIFGLSVLACQHGLRLLKGKFSKELNWSAFRFYRWYADNVVDFWKCTRLKHCYCIRFSIELATKRSRCGDKKRSRVGSSPGGPRRTKISSLTINDTNTVMTKEQNEITKGLVHACIWDYDVSRTSILVIKRSQDLSYIAFVCY